MEKRFCSGHAASIGFMIYDGSGIRVRSRGYVSEERGKKRELFYWIVFVSSIWTGMFFLLDKLSLGFSLWQTITLIGAAPFAIIAIWWTFMSTLGSIFRPLLIRWGNRRVRKFFLQLKEEQPEKWRAIAEYHACEHKLIQLLREGKPVTLHSLRAASPFAPSCGTGKNQGLILAPPSLDKLVETLLVAEEYFQKVAEQKKQQKKQSP